MSQRPTERPGRGAEGGSESWRVPPEAAGQRLDRWLADRCDEARNQVQRWIREGRVRVDGSTAKPSHSLVEGERIDCSRPAAAEERIEPESGELEVVYEDDDLVAVDKPAGLVVHPGAGNREGTLVHRLLARHPEMAGVGGPGRPGIVHRLDKATTGLLLAARHRRAHRALAAAFARRRIEKRYLAVVWGHPEDAGSIDQPIGRHPNHRKRMTVRPDGRPASSAWRVLGRAEGTALLEVSIETGRTHQIRVHLKWAGHPLVGDPVYGEKRWAGLAPRLRPALRDFPRPALHAWRLALAHPATGERLALEAPPPDDLARLWEQVGGAPLDELLPPPR